MATILFVVGDKAALTAGDPVLRDRLVAQGHTVTLRSDEEAEINTGFDGFLISDSCASATIGTKYSAVALPGIWLENGPWGTVGLGTASAQQPGVTQWVIPTASALTANLSGTVVIYTSASVQSYINTADLGTGAQALAQIDGATTRHPYVVYETGATLAGGTAAPARRVAFGLLNGSVALLTTAGLTLFDAAIAWALPVPVITVPRRRPRGPNYRR